MPSTNEKTTDGSATRTADSGCPHVCAFGCIATVALLCAITPIAMWLAGADPSPSTWRRLVVVTSVFCLLAATAGFWLGPDKVVRLLEDEWHGRLWASILIGVGLTALVQLLWRVAG